MTRLPIGEVISEFPAGTFNRLVDMLESFESLGGVAGLQAGPARSPFVKGLEALAVNKTGSDAKEFSIAGIGDAAFNIPDATADDKATHVILQGVVFEVVTATEEDHSGKFVIWQEPVAADATGRVLIPGATWARVDIKDEEDETCGVKDGSADSLESGKGSTPIIWKPAGTGVKWCVVQLVGGGGSESTSLVNIGMAITATTIEPMIHAISVAETWDEESGPAPTGNIKLGQGWGYELKGSPEPPNPVGIFPAYREPVGGPIPLFSAKHNVIGKAEIVEFHDHITGSGEDAQHFRVIIERDC